jgi:FAD:protein FMN transferase
MSEHRDTFACFGSECTVVVAGERDDGPARAAVELARRRLLEWHGQFSRFEPESELSRLNSDPRPTVAVSPLMGRLLAAAQQAENETDGLVDATLVGELEAAGYASDLSAPAVPLALALELAPERASAGPSLAGDWRRIAVDRRAGVVTRPPGVRFDSGGLAKGVFADELGALLGDHDAFAVDCAGDIRLGGCARAERQIHVSSPFDDAVLHTFSLARGAVATSGIGKRSWIDVSGRPAHHLLDPATGRPVFSGLVQVTALAPTATAAEFASKAALLSGPALAARYLPHGGVLVLDDGSHRCSLPGRRPRAQPRAQVIEHQPPARAR